jgi:uncharacterized protein YbjT (DUF2867 family)
MASAPDMTRPGKGPVVAVTGATGFLGRRLVKVLASRAGPYASWPAATSPIPAWEGLEPQLVIGDLANAGALAASATAPRRSSTWPA